MTRFAQLWQQGAVFVKGQGNNQVRAQVTEQLTTKEGLKIIAIRVAGPLSQRKELLTLIREDIKTIQDSSFPRLPFAEMVPCCCNECRTAQTPYFFDHAVLETFMQKGKTQIQCQISADDVEIATLVGSVFDLKEIEMRRMKAMTDEKRGDVNVYLNNVGNAQVSDSGNSTVRTEQKQQVSKSASQPGGNDQHRNQIFVGQTRQLGGRPAG